MNTQKQELIDKGYCIIDDVLPIQLAENIVSEYNQNYNWDFYDQQRHDKYSAHTPFSSNTLPQSNEVYTAKFNRNNFLEQNQVILEAFDKYFIPLLKEYSPFEVNDFDFRCYKLNQGDHYRVHCDGYAGKVNLIYYVNKYWRWDWGGILNVLSNDDPDFSHAIFPKFNRVVLLNNQSFSSPHYVSSVEKWALNPRLSIVSFNK